MAKIIYILDQNEIEALLIDIINTDIERGSIVSDFINENLPNSKNLTTFFKLTGLLKDLQNQIKFEDIEIKILEEIITEPDLK